MKIAYFSIFTALFLIFQLQTQAQSLIYSKIKINLQESPITAIAKLGLEVDHGNYAKGRHLINTYSNKEIALLKANDISYEVLIPDVQMWYSERSAADKAQRHSDNSISGRGNNDCAAFSNYNYPTPQNYEYGSMGGYLTYDELLETLDEMAELYPNLITAKQAIGEIQTQEGRPIYWLRLSDNPSMNEEESELLYTALHHAREPNSLAQMIFYIWYLLENYESDPEVKYLVDHTEMYFIPCVNPDGYVYNESTNPDGGGFWRKNRRSEDGNTFGVDLNRNYGFEWAHDDDGSSNEKDSQVYRGASAFSESETQAVRDFCNAHQFQITLNYHTSGNLLIYPWGFNNELTPDHATFAGFADAMTKENDFLAGTGIETVGYTVNGDSDDWMYGETESKPPIFSLTPEVGTTGFWPLQSEIDQLNKSCLLQNLTAAHLLLNYADATELFPEDIILASEDTLSFEVKKYGLETGDIRFKVSALNDKVVITENESSWTLAHLETQQVNVAFAVEETTVTNDELIFLIEIDNGLFVKTDTLRKRYIAGEINSIFADNGANTSLWEMDNSWGISNTTYFSAPSSYTDSPNRDYRANQQSNMTLKEPINLVDADQAFLSFKARWQIEKGYDYVQLLISDDGTTFEPLCGKYTSLGTANQAKDEPLYDGAQENWVQENIELTDYIGKSVWIQFQFVSDQFVEMDGFYFDDLEVNIISDSPTSTSNTFDDEIVSRFSISPNPFSSNIQVYIDLTQNFNDIQFSIVDILGRTLKIHRFPNLGKGVHQIDLQLEDLPKGSYWIRCHTKDKILKTQKVVKID